MTAAAPENAPKRTVVLADLLHHVDGDLLSGAMGLPVDPDLRAAIGASARLSARAAEALSEALDMPTRIACDPDGAAAFLIGADRDDGVHLLRHVAAQACAATLRRSIRREDRAAAQDVLGAKAVARALHGDPDPDATAAIPRTRDAALALGRACLADGLAPDAPERRAVELLLGPLPDPVPAGGAVERALASLRAASGEAADA